MDFLWDWFTEYILPIFLIMLIGFVGILMFYVGKIIFNNSENECNCIVEKVGC